MAYFVFKIFRMYIGAKAHDYDAVRKSLTFFAIITVILLTLTIVNACICTHNFHKGLKPHINNRKKGRSYIGEDKVATEMTTEMPYRIPERSPSSRMTID